MMISLIDDVKFILFSETIPQCQQISYNVNYY